MSFGFQSITNFKINKLVIQETGTYNQQFLRPWQTHVDYDVQSNFVSVAQQYGAHIPTAAYDQLSSGFLQKQAAPECNIDIPGGWNEKRIRFFMETQHEFATGGTVKTYYLGYTNHVGVTASGAIDPRMMFYVNSLVRTRAAYANIPGMGMVGSETVYETKQILQGNQTQTNGMFHNAQAPNQTLSMRPQELYRFFGGEGEIMSLGESLTGATVADTRLQIPSIGKMTDRMNNAPSSYIGNVLGGALGSLGNHQLGESKESCLNRQISGMESSSDNIAQDALFKSISNVHGSLAAGRFTYSDLMKVEPGIYNVTNYVIIPPSEKGKLHQVGLTSGWHGSDISTKAAASLAHSIPAIMTENLITRIVLTSTNNELGGRINTQIIHANSFSSGDMRQYYDRFRTMFEAIMATEITYRNSLTYMLEMNVDLLGETWIKISIDNGPVYDYVAPSFSDGLFSPMVSVNRSAVLNVANDFSCLFSTASESMYETPSQALFTSPITSI